MTAGAGARRRVFGILFATAVFIFLGLFVARHAAQLRTHDWSLRPGLFAFSVLVHIVSLGWGVRVWQLVLERMGAAVGYLSLARIWFLSSLGRYLPGKIWQFVGAAQLGSAVGLTPSLSVTALALHAGFFLLSALTCALYLVPEAMGQLSTGMVRLLRIGAPLLLLLAHPVIIRSSLRFIGRLTRIQPLEWRAGWGDGIRLGIWSLGGWIGSGLALYLFLLSATPLPLATAPGIIGVNALAFLAGYLVFFAPAGLGAKEGAMAALLSLYMPAGVAALLAVAARLWAILAEVIPALLFLTVRSLRTSAGEKGREAASDSSQ